MPTDANDISQAIAWWKAEPARFEADKLEIGQRFPGLVWRDRIDGAVRDAGGWRGRLPIWPFERPQPPGLSGLGLGLLVELVYPQAYPMVPPHIYAIEPAPEPIHLTDHRWHVNGDASLCLLQQANQWSGRDAVSDLLLKAAGWRIEFALMQADLIEAMSENGIVSTDQLDVLIGQLPSPATSPTA